MPKLGNNEKMREGRGNDGCDGCCYKVGQITTHFSVIEYDMTFRKSNSNYQKIKLI